ncbi:hypothetical protein [Rippkaea orientalis]|uniref:hypothetical protein n=1 Tax=Rippkaea orientalis TaxID=2546366 RepID=UPI000172575D
MISHICSSPKHLVSCLSILGITAILTDCGGNQQSQSPNGQSQSTVAITLPFQQNIGANGAGASFPAPLYQNWFILLAREIPQLLEVLC